MLEAKRGVVGRYVQGLDASMHGRCRQQGQHNIDR